MRFVFPVLIAAVAGLFAALEFWALSQPACTVTVVSGSRVLRTVECPSWLHGGSVTVEG